MKAHNATDVAPSLTGSFNEFFGLGDGKGNCKTQNLTGPYTRLTRYLELGSKACDRENTLRSNAAVCY
jgi:hypothetical protein